MVVHMVAGGRADVELGVKVHNQCNRMLHILCRDHVAIHLERSGAGAADAA